MSSPAEQFDQLVKEVFAPCYPVVARQIVEKTGIEQGLCLDIGCGSGFLGMAIAEASTMTVRMMDNDPEMLAICQCNVDYRHLDDRIQIQAGDVHKIPLADASVQLVVSRGSVFFWEDQVQAFREINRVLAPGGMACIGGGFGTVELKQQIDREMQRRDPEWSEHLRGKIGPGTPEKYRPILQAAGIKHFEIDHSPAGLWLVFERTEL